jgi:hypothetical protein
MSNRERWVVYPLLFLAIGMAWHNDIDFKQTLHDGRALEVELVRCKELEIVGEDNKPRAKLGTGTNGDAVAEAMTAEGMVALRLGHVAQQLVLLITDSSNEHLHPLNSLPDPGPANEPKP